MEQRHCAIKKKVIHWQKKCRKGLWTRNFDNSFCISAVISASLIDFLNISRMCPTMIPSWTSMPTQLTGSPWRDTSTREPATPSRPGAGTSLPTECLPQNSCIVFYAFLPPHSSLKGLNCPLWRRIVSKLCAFLSVLLHQWIQQLNPWF